MLRSSGSGPTSWRIPRVRRCFAAEARLLASLDHPHIVRVYDYVEADVYALVMERMRGGSVAEWFSRERVLPAPACAVALAALCGLQYAHDRGVLHRDIKPENLLFGEAGLLRVGDFGIAKVIGSGGTPPTTTRHGVGTPAFMAPEQVRRSLGQLSAATDVWAVGAILYEMLAGPHPSGGDEELSSRTRPGRPSVPHPLADDPPLQLRSVKNNPLAQAIRPPSRCPPSSRRPEHQHLVGRR
jgi:serine/threonine protein kinase